MRHRSIGYSVLYRPCFTLFYSATIYSRLLIGPVLPLNNKVIPARSYQDAHELLLYKLQHGQERKNGMYPVLAHCKKHIKRDTFLFFKIIYQERPLALQAIVIFDNHVLGFGVALIE